MAQSPDPNDIPSLDPSARAQKHLDSLLNDTTGSEDITILDDRIAAREEKREEETLEREELRAKEEVPSVTARAARKGARVLNPITERTATRLLILTRNSAIRELGSYAQRHMLELGSLFAEIHVVMLTVREEETVPIVRLADNIWLYSTESSSWWRAGFDAHRLAKEQLSFGGGFRADIIVAEDPFECGLVARFLSDTYERPFEVHVLEDIYEPAFQNRDEHNALRIHLAAYVLNRAHAVRASTEFIKGSILHEHPKLAPYTEVLPTYYNLSAWHDAVPTVDLRERYPQFKFIILHASTMFGKSNSEMVIHGVAPLLRTYPTIGLVIVGNGPSRPQIEKNVISFGIARQVAFEPMSDALISYMKTAHVFVHLSEDAEEDIYVLEAAAVKLPLIANARGVAGNLFIDNESALLCQGPDPAVVSRHLKTFLNDNQVRVRLSLNAFDTVFERVEQDYGAYLRAYRGSIERCALGPS